MDKPALYMEWVHAIFKKPLPRVASSASGQAETARSIRWRHPPRMRLIHIERRLLSSGCQHSRGTWTSNLPLAGGGLDHPIVVVLPASTILDRPSVWAYIWSCALLNPRLSRETEMAHAGEVSDSKSRQWVYRSKEVVMIKRIGSVLLRTCIGTKQPNGSSC